jgi:hypothetical protein
MADNIGYTPGTGATIAADDVSGVLFQKVKVYSSTDGTEAPLTVAEDAAHASGDHGIAAMAVRADAPANKSGTDGDYEPLQVSGGLLWVRPLGLLVSCQTNVTRPTPDTTQYAAGDAISDSTSAPTSGGFTLSNAARVSGGAGVIMAMTVSSSNDPATRLSGEVFLFNTSVTNINDNTAFVVSDDEIKTCVGVVPFSLFDAGNNGFAHITGLNIPFVCSGSANLRFLLRARNAYTPASAEVITITAFINQVN